MYLSNIKTTAVALLLTSLLLGCSKGGGGGGNNPPPPPPSEENLSIGIDPDPGADFAKALGTNYDFKVLIKSKMPAQGVEGTVVFRKEADNSLISSQNITGTTSPINVSISNIAFNEVGVVTIELKSKSKPANTASKTFKLHRK
jgi:hypothetical protein